MICCGVPRTLPSGPDESNTRLTTLPTERLRLLFDRDRDFEDLISFYSPAFGLVKHGPSHNNALVWCVPAVLGMASKPGEPAVSPPFARKVLSGESGLAKSFLQQNRRIVDSYGRFQPV